MPKIKIKQDDKVEQIYVDDNTLEKILVFINDTKFKGTQLINIDGLNFQKRDFKGFVKGIDPVLSEGYDLTNPAHREVINEFKEMLENLKLTSVLEKPLEYYGDLPVTNEEWDKKKLGKDKVKSADRKFTRENGYVNNPILGTTHWSEVAWAEQQRLIGRYPQGNWFVALDEGVQKQMAAARKFDAYNAKRRALAQMIDYEANLKKEEQVRLQGVEI